MAQPEIFWGIWYSERSELWRSRKFLGEFGIVSAASYGAAGNLVGIWWEFGGNLVEFWWEFGGNLVGIWWEFGESERSESERSQLWRSRKFGGNLVGLVGI
jgi:hypothetical protein